MKKIILFAAALFQFCNTLLAQEQSVLTHYHINPLIINPAIAGSTGNHNVFLNARNSWSGFPGADKTVAATYDGPIGKTFGLGAAVYSENIASLQRLRVALNYAFRYQLDKLQVGFGFSTEFSQTTLDRDVLSDINYDPNDNIIEDATDGLNQFDATLGFHGMYNNQTFFNIAFPNIIMARLDGSTNNDNNDPEGFYLFNMGHRFKSKDYGFTIEPSLLLRKARNVPFQADLNLKGYFLDDRLIGGVSYRGASRGAVAILVGTQLDKFAFYYSFDVSFQEFQTYSNGSHEITLGLSFPRKERTDSLPGN